MDIACAECVGAFVKFDELTGEFVNETQVLGRRVPTVDGLVVGKRAESGVVTCDLPVSLFGVVRRGNVLWDHQVEGCEIPASYFAVFLDDAKSGRRGRNALGLGFGRCVRLSRHDGGIFVARGA